MKRLGSTLIEVLIAMTVTSILSGIMVLYGSTGRKQMNLYVETVKLAQIILKAKSHAISIYYNPNSLTCGYGVLIDAAKNSYSLFRYTGTVPDDCKNITNLNPANIKLTEGFRLSNNLSFDDGIGTVDAVLFVPPDPRTYLWSRDAKVAPSGQITLTIDGTEEVRTILLTTGGQVSY